MAWDPAEYHLFEMVHGVELVQKRDNEEIIILCVLRDCRTEMESELMMSFSLLHVETC